MASKTTTPAPYTAMFPNFGANGTDTIYAALDGMPLFHQVAADAPGFEELQATFGRFNLPQLAPRRLNEAFDALVESILDGADPTEATLAYEAEEAKRNVRPAVENVIRRAKPLAVIRSRQWIESPKTQTYLSTKLQAHLDRLLGDLKEQAAIVGSYRTFEAAALVPDSARALAVFHGFAQELWNAKAVIERVAGVSLEPLYPQGVFNPLADWPALSFFRDYTEAWPTFWNRAPLERPAWLGPHELSQPVSRPWWLELSPVEAAFKIVDRGLALWAPTREQLRKKRLLIDSKARSIREFAESDEWAPAAKAAGDGWRFGPGINAQYPKILAEISRKQIRDLTHVQARILAASRGLDSEGPLYELRDRLTPAYTEPVF